MIPTLTGGKAAGLEGLRNSLHPGLTVQSPDIQRYPPAPGWN